MAAKTTLEIIIEGKDNASKVFGTIKGGVVGFAGVATGALTAVGVAAFQMSGDFEQSAGRIQAALGATEAEAEGMGEVVKNVFTDNFGGSVAEVESVLVQAKRQLELFDDTELENVTKQIVAIKDAFGENEQAITNAAGVLQSQFGLSAQEALDLITTGLQEIPVDDLLDTISEYGVVFKDAGFDAAEFYSILESGAQGGVLGSDKIGDAIKEMGIRLSEGGEEASQALAGMGINLNVLSAQVQSGDATWAGFFGQIVSGLNRINDPIARQQAQVALFGTAAEDLGVSFTEGLTAASGSLEEFSGSTANLMAQYENSGSLFEEFKRKGIEAFTPLTDKIREGAQEALPDFIAKIEDFATQLEGTTGPALAIINDSLERINIAFGGAGENVNTLSVSLAILESILNSINVALQLVAVGFDKVADAAEIATGLVDQIGQINELTGGKLVEGAEVAQGLTTLASGPTGAVTLAAEGVASGDFNSGQVINLLNQLVGLFQTQSQQPQNITISGDLAPLVTEVETRVGGNLRRAGGIQQ